MHHDGRRPLHGRLMASATKAKGYLGCPGRTLITHAKTWVCDELGWECMQCQSYIVHPLIWIVQKLIVPVAVSCVCPDLWDVILLIHLFQLSVYLAVRVLYLFQKMRLNWDILFSSIIHLMLFMCYPGALCWLSGGQIKHFSFYCENGPQFF